MFLGIYVILLGLKAESVRARNIRAHPCVKKVREDYSEPRLECAAVLHRIDLKDPHGCLNVVHTFITES
jgi:hypothetical protein